MDALAQYSSGSEAEDETKNQLVSVRVNSAPAVASAMIQHGQYLVPGQKTMKYNLPAYSTMMPMQGPEHPFRHKSVGSGGIKNDMAGAVEATHMQDFNFVEQYHTFSNYGFGRGTAGELIGDADAAHEKGEASVFSATAMGKKKEWQDQNKKRKREELAAAGDQVDEDNPWAEVEYDEAEVQLTEEQQAAIDEVTAANKREKKDFNEDEDYDNMTERKISHLLPPRLPGGYEHIEPKTTFHGESEVDYQGRSWVEPPSDVHPGDGDHTAYIPKRCIHKWVGHSKGVQAIELFPKYGHLLLSASMDNKIKIWDVNGDRNCMRTYLGHNQGVRGIKFSNDGSSFLSCSFDRHIRLWDTETGQCKGTFTNRKVPYCVKFYPKDNNIFVFGESNNRIMQFDVRSGKNVQEYNHHLQAVNSITFAEGGRRFISTSDDKKILIWEWNIPVPIKYISEPSMHSIPAVTLKPQGDFFVGQSLDNKIVTFTARDRFKEQRKKVFKGHEVAGYACQMNFSPNGRMLMSGDGEGRLFFWDWKTTKMFRKLKAHNNGPCIGCVWHPLEPSKVVTCGWDGLIKYWD